MLYLFQSRKMQSPEFRSVYRKYCITRFFRGRKFSRKVNFREYTVHAKISSRENIFPRKYLIAKISSSGNIFPRIVSVPQIRRLVGLGYVVYYSIT